MNRNYNWISKILNAKIYDNFLNIQCCGYLNKMHMKFKFYFTCTQLDYSSYHTIYRQIDHNSLNIHTYISSVFMNTKIYLMKINRIWHLEAGEIIQSIIVQTDSVILFSLEVFLHGCLVLMSVSAVCQGVA